MAEYLLVRVAGIDCGTNSIRLLIADVAEGSAAPHSAETSSASEGLPAPHGATTSTPADDAPTPLLQDLVRRMEIARLGEGVDRTGMLAPAALERTFTVISDYAAQCREYGVERIRVAATSATRDASNRSEFIDGVRAILGVTPEVLSGAEEARLSFLGAAGGVAAATQIHPAEPMLVVDIGGGSTELVLGANGAVISEYSMDVGSVRMRERHLQSDPPTADEIAAARADINRHLDEAAEVVDFAQVRTIVGVAGTITSITAEVLGLTAYDRTAINGAVLPVVAHEGACDWFLNAPTATRATRTHLHPGRIDVIGAGSLVWATVLERVTAAAAGAGHPISEVITSEHDILDGITLSLR